MLEELGPLLKGDQSRVTVDPASLEFVGASAHTNNTGEESTHQDIWNGNQAKIAAKGHRKKRKRVR